MKIDFNNVYRKFEDNDRYYNIIKNLSSGSIRTRQLARRNMIEIIIGLCETEVEQMMSLTDKYEIWIKNNPNTDYEAEWENIYLGYDKDEANNWFWEICKRVMSEETQKDIKFVKNGNIKGWFENYE